ncbi:MAG: hypothetical protein HYX69_06935 [Planctomycetia bacterium]|nr:hypothetical protein [Planctomycetia bacterium]
MLRTIVPDLEGRPLYLLPANEVPAGILPESCAGIHGPSLDLVCKPLLEAQDRWEGRGPCLVVDTEAENVTAIALHEMAHALSRDFPDDEPSDYVAAEAARYQAFQVAADSDRDQEAIARFGAPAWLQHDADFIRATAHIVGRARNRGETVSFGDTMASDYEVRTPWWQYFSALDAEIECYAGASFSSIRAMRPPAEFVELWCGDVQAWLMQQAEPTRAARFIVEAEILKFARTEAA